MPPTFAAAVGGIGANRENPGRYFYQNAIMGVQLIEYARRNQVEKTIVVGTICSYPKFTPVPFREEALWDGYPEETNAPYGIAKKALLVQCQAYRRQYGFNAISLMPTNLYGPGDNFDLENSHVLPALIRRFHEAKLRGDAEVVVWGTGTPRREFLYVDDMAAASVFVMNLDLRAYQAQVQPQLSHINVGYGSDVTIAELAATIAKVVGYPGRVSFDTSKPDGAPRKLMDSGRLNAMGWQARVGLERGLQSAYQDMLTVAKVRDQ